MMDRTSSENLKIGDVVQINPEACAEQGFAGCFMLVTELKSWGVQGFIAMPYRKNELPREAYLRCRFEDIEYIGRAAWHPTPPKETSDEGV